MSIELSDVISSNRRMLNTCLIWGEGFAESAPSIDERAGICKLAKVRLLAPDRARN